MATVHIAVVVGSIRRESINRKLADALVRLGPPDFQFNMIKIDDVPIYNQDDDSHQALSVRRMKVQILEAQGLLFVTPEYNRSIPGVLKNAIDQASRPYGKSAWSGKPAGILGASVGSLGSALAQQHLRNVLAYLDVPTMGQPEAFIHAAEGLFNPDGSMGVGCLEFAQGWMNQYAKWIRAHVEALIPEHVHLSDS